MPKVSVIIPTYNYGIYIDKSIDSVLSQTYTDFEIIVVDDGSTDNTKTIIETKYRDKVKYIYQENKGAPAARNRAARESKGEYLAFLDSDDSFFADNIEKKVAALEKNPTIGMVYSDGNYIMGNSTNKSSNYKLSAAGAKLSGDISLMLLKGYRIESSAVVLRAACFNKVGGFDEEIVGLDDYDLFLRISFIFNALFIDECLFESIRHKGSISSGTAIIDIYKSKSRIIYKIEKMYSVRAELLGVEWHKLRAAAKFFDGKIACHNGSYKDGSRYFFESIKIYPFQKRVYFSLFVSLIKKLLN
jgi:glycosyltransferase involved in cell wall biosynthesis